MTGQLADYLSAHADRIAELWARTAGESRSAGGARGPRQFVNAVLLALTAEDIRPLLAFYELDPTRLAGFEDRLEKALTHLAALRQATLQAAADEKMDPHSRLDLAGAAADDLMQVGRRLSVESTQAVIKQATLTGNSARGTSLSITMHELRRPLTILNSYGQLLATGMLGQMPESAMVAIEGITASTEMMVRMVNALAEVSRLEDPDDKLILERLTLGELIKGATEHIAMELKLRQCEIEQDIAEDVVVNVDKRRLVLALNNILGNAVKHAPDGSTIHLHAWLEGKNVSISVRDEGPGFPPEDAPHLFDKYFRSVAERQRKVPGSGLGLFIVKTVAERHNGTVVAKSEPGKGAEFIITIPQNEKGR